MVSVILAVALGILFTFLALENPAMVPVNFLGFFITLPIYIIAAIVFLSGIVVTLFFHIFDSLGSSIDLNSKESELKSALKTNQELTSQNQKLAIENTSLQEKLNNANSKLNKNKMEAAGQKINNFFDKVKHALRGDEHSAQRGNVQSF